MCKFILTGLFFCFICSFMSCKPSKCSTVKEAEYIEYSFDSFEDEMMHMYSSYIGDSMLSHKKELIHFYLEKYFGLNHFKSYVPPEYIDSWEYFQHPLPIKPIRKGGEGDTVFVLSPLDSDNSGDSYYFFDKSLPRLETQTPCCDPSHFFVAEDMDEDGINEVGIYYAGCVSRYKSVRLYTLKNDQWIEIGYAAFDADNPDCKHEYASLVKKIRKNTFEMLNFDYESTYWKTITLD